MADKKVRWGIVGPGRIAHTFAKDIAFTNNAVLQAVASRSLETAVKFANEYDIPKFYGHYSEMLADPDVDAVYIATPHTLHVGQMQQAILSGKSVLCEKPFTVTPAETELIINQAAASNVTVMEALWTYFLPAIQKAKAWVDEGRVGKIVQFKADFGIQIPYDPNDRTYDRRLAGGCLLDMGIYPISLAWLFMQEHPHKINVVSRLAPNGVEDDLAMLFTYKESVATLGASFRANLPNYAFIIGEKATIEITDFWSASECSLYTRDQKLDHFKDARKGSGFEFQIESISDDILNGRSQSLIVPLETSLAFQGQMARVKKIITQA